MESAKLTSIRTRAAINIQKLTGIANKVTSLIDTTSEDEQLLVDVYRVVKLHREQQHLIAQALEDDREST